MMTEDSSSKGQQILSRDAPQRSVKMDRAQNHSVRHKVSIGIQKTDNDKCW